MSKPVEKFYEFIRAKLTTCAEERDLTALENVHFADVFFFFFLKKMHLELRRGRKED